MASHSWMIISHRHRFIFVAVPKTGTHSVRQALREHMGEEDLEQVRLFVEKRFPISELAALRHGHLTLRQVRPHLPPEHFSSYFKFGFVRNPFDRFISYCAFMTRGSDRFQTNPTGVMHHLLFVAPPTDHILFQPQNTFFTDENGLLLGDRIGRIETMQVSYDDICEQIGIVSRPLDKVNASVHGDYRQYYDQRSIDGVAKLYSRDLELFGYNFE